MAKIFENKKNSPKVFISYSYDGKIHEKWVENLTNSLRSNAGVNAVIDKFALKNTNDLDQIMTKGFKDSNKVVIIVTRNYAKKANAEAGGVGFETKLATIIERNPKQKSKLIFVKRDKAKNFNEVFPFQFKDHYAIDMSNDADFDEKFKELYHKIWDQPYIKISPIGDNPFDTSGQAKNQIRYKVNNATVFEILEKSGFEPYNLKQSDLLKESIIIWPVVPRQHVNLIHYSQIEVIRVLSLLGWSTKIIIANCGQSDMTPSKNDIDFKMKLESNLHKKKIKNFSIDFLNTYFSPNFLNGNKILANFVDISSALKINQLSFFNIKDGTYDEEAQSEINDRTTLKYISPLFTWSASIYEANEFFKNNENSKAIIIAGRDEESQWSHVITEINSHIGAIFIPILKQEDLKTVYQEKKPLFFSKKQLEDELGKGNIDRWLFQSFTNLAEFPNIVHSLPYCKNKNESCLNDIKFNKCLDCIFPNESNIFSENIDKRKFVEAIYSKIAP